MRKEFYEYYCDVCNKKIERQTIKLCFDSGRYSAIAVEGLYDSYPLNICDDDKHYCSYNCLKEYVSQLITNIECEDYEEEEKIGTIHKKGEE